MNETDQRIAIAEACGWRYPGSTCLKSDAWNRWIPPVGAKSRKVPDYLNDLNAMHDAEKTVRYELQPVLLDRLKRAVMNYDEGVSDWYVYTASPKHRAEAFLRTLGLWKESR